MLIPAGIYTYWPDATEKLCEAMMPCPVGNTFSACSQMYGLKVASIALIMC